MVLSHGAGRGIDGNDLTAVATAMPRVGIDTYLVEQPWVARGRKVADRPQVLDAVLTTVLEQMDLTVPLILAGRSAGARSSVRVAPQWNPVACLAMAFPLHPPGRPERSRVEELLNSGVPTLVIQGERDPMGRPEEFPSGTLLKVIPWANHGYGVPKSAPLSQTEVYDLVVDLARTWLVAEILPAV